MWRAIGALAGVVLVAALPSPALATPTNGQLAMLVDERLVTVNPDGSGVRTLWTAPQGEVLAGLAWSPDGNKVAFVATRRIVVYDLEAGRASALTNPPEGVADADPGWSDDGRRVGFRRAGERQQAALSVDAAGGDLKLLPFPVAAATTALTWHPNLAGVTLVVANLMPLPGVETPPSVTGAPAWSPSGGLIAFANGDGLFTLPRGDPFPARVADAPAGPPRWAPDAAAVVYPSGAELRLLSAAGGEPRVVFTAPVGRILSVDWQPCEPLRTASCESVTPPRCAAATVAVTTQADQAVDLPGAPCHDPGGRTLTIRLIKAPDHGTLDGRRYTPAPGFVGEDGVAYRVTNGVNESDPVRIRIFVVPRPAPAQPVVATVRPPALRAPFPSAQSKPRLDRRRWTVVRLSCDQQCTIAVRLTARLGSKRTLKGPLVRRTLAARQVVSLRLRLPTKPAGRVKAVWIVGSARNAAGVRPVNVPVSVPR